MASKCTSFFRFTIQVAVGVGLHVILLQTATAQKQKPEHLVQLPNGNYSVIEPPSKTPRAKVIRPITAPFKTATRSEQAGSQWRPLAPIEGGPVLTLALADGLVFAGTLNGGIFISHDNGQTWRAANKGFLGGQVNEIANVGGSVLAATASGLYRTTDLGQSWTLITNTPIHALANLATGIWAGSDIGEVFRSIDNGVTFTESTALSTPLSPIDIYAFAVQGGNLLAGTRAGLFRSTDNGLTWVAIKTLWPDEFAARWVFSFATSGDTLYAATWPFTVNGVAASQVSASKDGGQTWATVGGPIIFQINQFELFGPVFRITIDNGKVYALGPWGIAGLDGQKWTEFNGQSGFPMANSTFTMMRNGKSLLVGTRAGVYTLTEDGRSWRESNSGLTCAEYTATAITNDAIWAAANGNGLFRSVDQGSTWAKINGITDVNGRRYDVRQIHLLNNTFLASTAFGGIFRSDDNGITWRAINTGLCCPQDSSYPDLASGGNNLYARDEFTFHQLNADGRSWTANTSQSVDPAPIAAFGRTVYASESRGQILLRSADGGSSFSRLLTLGNRDGSNQVLGRIAAKDNFVCFSARINDFWRVLVSSSSVPASPPL